MIIGDRRFFTQAHCENMAGMAPPYLCELAVHCLELVAEMSDMGIPFRFKGGNSLLVLLQAPRRFSIDVDIVSALPKKEMIKRVEELAEKSSVFKSVEIRQHKTKPWLPMVSFKLFFDSHYQKKEEAYVMLDAVLEPAPYPGQKKKISCGLLYFCWLDVEVPVISGMTADKFLTIGPSALGIPLGKNKEAQRIKHIFDIGLLKKEEFEKEIFVNALASSMEQENAIQRKEITLKEVLVDTECFCSLPLKFDKCPSAESAGDDHYLKEIVKGYDEFKKHVFKGEYRWEDFQNDCRTVLDLLKETSIS